MSDASPISRKPFEGWGAAAARGLAAFTGALVRGTSKVMGEVTTRGGAAVAEFRARPEHARYRAYALAGYAGVVAATLLGQLWTDNALHAYVRVQPVELPALTQIFVRNDSRRAWQHVKLTLNGIYGYENNELGPGAHVLLPVNRFAVYDANGKATYAPKGISPRTLAIECESGRYETELHP